MKKRKEKSERTNENKIQTHKEKKRERFDIHWRSFYEKKESRILFDSKHLLFQVQVISCSHNWSPQKYITLQKQITEKSFSNRK